MAVTEWAILLGDKKVEWTQDPARYAEQVAKYADVIFTFDESAPLESAYYFTKDTKKLSCKGGPPTKSYEQVAGSADMPMLSEVTTAREAKEKADAEKAAAGDGKGKGQTSATNPNGKGDGKTTSTSSPDGKGPPLDPFETAAREVAIGGALAQGDTSGNLKDSEGDRHGVPQGKNKGGYSNPLLQAGVGIVGIAIGLGLKPKDFVKQVREALGLGKPVIVTAVDETAARKLADELIAENGGQYVLAEASRKHEVIIPYAMGEKFTHGLGGKLQAHKILEKQAFEKVW
ncbi:MAG TPA: hypothetical protein PK156_19480, partial [Polyangium sp.]|nr:hypothetical protein [Polyangium sp.]